MISPAITQAAAKRDPNALGQQWLRQRRIGELNALVKHQRTGAYCVHPIPPIPPHLINVHFYQILSSPACPSKLWPVFIWVFDLSNPQIIWRKLSI